MEPQLFSCGLQICGSSYYYANHASMEPQLFSCGLQNNRYLWVPNHLASMEPQLFSCGLHGYPIHRFGYGRSFNGAATFQLRIAVTAIPLLTPLKSLQWSRNFSVADCSKSVPKSTVLCLLQWSRNFSVADCTTMQPSEPNHIYSFNGAATFQLRIDKY